MAVHRSESAVRAMPPWTNVQADVDLVCKLHERLSDVYDVSKLDVVVVGIFHQVDFGYAPALCTYSWQSQSFRYQSQPAAARSAEQFAMHARCREAAGADQDIWVQVAELLVGVPAPVLYWEQGHEWLFGDPVRFQVGSGLSLVVQDGGVCRVNACLQPWLRHSRCHDLLGWHEHAAMDWRAPYIQPHMQIGTGASCYKLLCCDISHNHTQCRPQSKSLCQCTTVCLVSAVLKAGYGGLVLCLSGRQRGGKCEIIRISRSGTTYNSVTAVMIAASYTISVACTAAFARGDIVHSEYLLCHELSIMGWKLSGITSGCSSVGRA